MRRLYLIAIFTLIVASFFAGSFFRRMNAGNNGEPCERKILYYVDPMNPVIKSDKPGIAPCGMKLEPVYAEDAGPGNGDKLPAGTVRVTPDRQQLIGVKVAAVEESPWNYTIRVLGRVVPDETRIYRINAGTDGWVKKITSATTDSLVEKDELLATFYAPEYFSAMKAYLYGLRSYDRFKSSGQEAPEQLEVTDANIENYRNALRNLGMTEYQLDEIMRTRQGTDQVEIRAPASGFILLRSLSLGERFVRGTELYRIADLSEIWIVVDTFENEASYLKPGMQVRVTAPNLHRNFFARVSKVPPRFDTTSRTLQVRLEARNPELSLRSDMFVDVDLPIQLPPCISVPAGAVLDSGRRKTVFVDAGNGFFEPRTVKTGWRFAERVEITEGLSPGEQIVVSGNFLIDSESRMKLAAAGLFGAISQDPVCGTEVDENKARLKDLTSEHGGQPYYFCSEDCKKKFDQNPAVYLATDQAPDSSVMTEEIKHEGAQEFRHPVHPHISAVSEEMKSPEEEQAEPKVEKTKSPETDQSNQTKTEDHGISENPASSVGHERLKDPVCGRDVTPETAAEKSEYLGKTYFFCSDKCKMAFDGNPDPYLEKPGETSSQAIRTPQATRWLRKRGGLR